MQLVSGRPGILILGLTLQLIFLTLVLLNELKLQSPTPSPGTGTHLRTVRDQAAELCHPLPSSVFGKLVFHETWVGGGGGGGQEVSGK